MAIEMKEKSEFLEIVMDLGREEEREKREQLEKTLHAALHAAQVENERALRAAEEKAQREAEKAQREAQASLIAVLRARFGSVPRALQAEIRALCDTKSLMALMVPAATAPSLDAFKSDWAGKIS